MKPKPEQEAIPLNTQELEAKLNEIERTMGAETAQPFRLLLGWVLRLQQLIEKKNITLKRLRHMIFGAPTERTSDLEAKQELPTPTGSEAEQAGVTSQEGGG